MIGNIVVVIIW